MIIKMVDRGMSITEYEPICLSMLAWLKEHNIKHQELMLEWYILPSDIDFEDPMDATLFKLKFGL